MEETQLSTEGMNGLVKRDMCVCVCVYVYNGPLFSPRKEGNSDMHRDVDEYWGLCEVK